MTGVMDREQKFRLNHFDLLVPDGQPVRWVLNALYGAGLSDRVYGPSDSKIVCERGRGRAYRLFLREQRRDSGGTEGSTRDRFPGLMVAGMEPSKFRRLTPEEKSELAARIAIRGVHGFCRAWVPGQEIFAYEFRDLWFRFSPWARRFRSLQECSAGPGVDAECRSGVALPVAERAPRLAPVSLLNPAYLFLVLSGLGLSKFSDRRTTAPRNSLR